MEQILGPRQKMYLILCLAEGMRDECAGKEELKADYQIHSRIYANAFASMIRYGAEPGCGQRDGMVFLTTGLEGRTYSCPTRTVKNIMKAEFASVEEKLPALAGMLLEEEAKAAAGMRANRKRKKTESPGPVMQTKPAQAETPAQAKPSREEMDRMLDIVPGQDGSSAQVSPGNVEDTVSGPFGESATIPSVKPIQEPGPLPAMPEAGDGRPAAARLAPKETGSEEPPAHIREEEEANGGNADVWTPIPVRRGGWPSVQQAGPDSGTPEPAAKDGRPAQDTRSGIQAMPSEKHAEPAGRGPLSKLSRFLPKSKKQDVMGDAPAPLPMQDMGEARPDEIPHVGEEGRGERICHTHYVMLRKTYGTRVTGPYIIQVWPTEVIEMCPDRMPSAIFVRAQAPNGTVICKVNEGRTKYIVLDIDNKQFNVFGYWESGKFITEVSAINKTESIYTMSEEVEQECPEQASDTFLDQFWSRELHRPEFFVVPVSSRIPESGTVSIAAFIRVKDKNYPVTSKGPGDTLRFTYEGQLSEISGWWEDGRFAFAVLAVGEE